MKMDFRTKDVVSISVGCQQQIIFIVSLNNDDDNENTIVDFKETLPLKTIAGQIVEEDNLRQFDFNHPDAKRVFIEEPKVLAAHESALGKRVRAYESDKRSQFRFGMRDTPVTMYLEGIRKSLSINDIGFETQYFRADDTTICGPFIVGTVVDVNAKLEVATSGGASFGRKNKMLISGIANASVRLVPSASVDVEWSYDGQGTFDTPNQPTSRFSSSNVSTPVPRIGRDRIRVKLTARDTIPAGQIIEASIPVTLTSPHRLRVENNRFQRETTTGWEDANQGQITLIDVYFPYEMLDQEGHSIKSESAYAGCKPQKRENIGDVLASPIVALNNWIPANLRYSPDWRDALNGKINDHIQVRDIDKDLVVQTIQGQRMFDPVLRQVGGVFMNVPAPNTHIWQIGVMDPNGTIQNIVNATRNEFSAIIAATRQHGGGIEIRIRTIYRVNLPP